jgi:CpeS-like protein
LRMRTSTVKRFGGFSTATFCTEFRVTDADGTPVESEAAEPVEAFSLLGW